MRVLTWALDGWKTPAGKIISVILSFALVFSMSNVIAYAADADEQDENVTTTIDEPENLEIDLQDDEIIVGDGDDKEKGQNDPEGSQQPEKEVVSHKDADNPSTNGTEEIVVVTFKIDDQIFSTKNVIKGHSCSEPGPPTPPAGKTSFLGWYQKNKEGNLAGSPYDFSQSVDQDITLVAQFSNKWLVEFKDANGKVIFSESVENGENAQKPNVKDPTEKGKLFDYWTLDGNKEFIFAETPITGNITLQPKFVDARYVFFNTQGSLIEPQVVKDGAKASNPGAPSREGFDFIGWSTTEGATEADFNFNTPITADTTLYAVWQGKTVPYTVVYWFEKPNVKGTSYDPSDYAFHSSDSTSFKATAGSTVTIDAIKNSSSYKTVEEQLKYGEYLFCPAMKVSGNGNSILNVYFKRTEYTLTFALGDVTTGESNNGQTKYNEMTFNGKTYKDDVEKYEFSAKYEQDITNLWPSGFNATFKYSGDDKYGLYSWQTKGGPSYGSKLLILNSNLADAAVENNNIVEATAFWYKVSEKEVNYYFEWVEEETPDASKTYNNKVYVKDEAYSQCSILGNVGVAKKIDGLIFAGMEKQESSNPNIITFYYDRDVKDLSFNSLGGSTVEDQKVPYGKTMKGYEPDDPTRNGYKFAGWFSTPDCTPGTEYDWETETMPNSNVQLYAKWEGIDFTATFKNHKDDTEAVKTQGVAKNDYVKDPGTYKIGVFYDGLGIFQGWMWDLNGIPCYYPWETPVTRDINLYASWKTDGFTVTYETGDIIGITGDVPVDPNEYELGVKALVQSAPTLTAPNGMVFVGWKSPSGAVYYPGAHAIVEGNMVLTAQFVSTSEVIELCFNPNGATGNDQKWYLQKGTDIALPAGFDGWSKPGYDLIGWSTTKGVASEENIQPVGDQMNINNNGMILYAQWAPQDDALAYDANGGTGTTEATEGKVDQTVTVAENGFAREGYTFAGWNTAADGTGTSYAAGAGYKLTADEDVLYAQWTINSYKIEIEVVNGTADVESPASVKYGDSQTIRFFADENYALDTVTVDGKTAKLTGDEYVFEKVDADHKIKVVYAEDKIGTDNPGEGDGVPDKYQIVVTYKIQGGYWYDAPENVDEDAPYQPDEDIKVVLNTYELNEGVWKATEITDEMLNAPSDWTVKAKEGYAPLSGNWNKIPSVENLNKKDESYADTEFAYSFLRTGAITITFKSDEGDELAKPEVISTVANVDYSEYQSRVEGKVKESIKDSNGNNYVLVSVGVLPEGVVDSENPVKVEAIYSLDNTGVDNPGEGDGVPDKYQATVSYKAGTGAKSVSVEKAVVTLFDSEGNWAVDGTGYLTKAQIADATADEGYNQDTESWDNGGKPTTTTPITKKITYTVSFDKKVYTIAITVENGTSDADAESIEVKHGDGKAIQFTANDGYALDTVTVDGEEADLTEGKYEFENVTSDREIKVVYSEDENGNNIPDWKEAHYTITYKDGVNGTVFADQIHENILVGLETPAFVGSYTRDGYNFTGWSPAIAETVTGHATYVAQWERINTETPVVPNNNPGDNPGNNPGNNPGTNLVNNLVPNAGTTPVVIPAAAVPAAGAAPADGAGDGVVIPDDENPLAAPEDDETNGEEMTIADDENPMSAFDDPDCWVHILMIIGMILTVIYGGLVIARRLNNTKEIENMDKTVSGSHRRREYVQKREQYQGA